MTDTDQSDSFDLNRFMEAQRDTYDQALAEILRGAKRTHWMWFVFPQIVGLGSSPMARRFAIHSLAEAQAYLAHPVLGPRYEECVAALQDPSHSTAERVFGDIDAAKLRSSLTLFQRAGGGSMIEAALERWFGSADEATLRILATADHGS
ncbi:MAG TPA: DUF1810 domain-containing protein [Novosphingobium sp.]|nr:DUF1810 domain-containing protein [Novosphingobium sp.]